VVAPGIEACDDGNKKSADGCSASCKVEHGYSCNSAQPSVCLSSCGDGVLASDEACDDKNAATGDGCAGCQLEAGYSCSGEPSVCVEGHKLHQGGLSRLIPDDAYNGTTSSMRCISLSGPAVSDTVSRVTLTVAIDHSYLGDLTIKVISPNNKKVTVLERAIGDNPQSNPTGDDGGGCCGDASNLVASHPITFDDLASADAETLGASLSGSQAVCKDGGGCSFKSNPDAAGKRTPPQAGLAGLVGEPVTGVWRVCVGDSEAYDVGFLRAVTLHLRTP
jgi:cysteine-rich repeat protein